MLALLSPQLYQSSHSSSNTEAMAVEIKLSRTDRIYRPPDVVDGCIIITTPSSISHQGIRIAAIGTVTMQPSLRSVGVIESLYSSVKPIQLLNKSVDISPAGKISAGTSEVPFHIALDGPKGGFVDGLYETYHGAYINIQDDLVHVQVHSTQKLPSKLIHRSVYVITAEVLRGYLQKNLSATFEFIVEGAKGKAPRKISLLPEFVQFYITQDTQKHPLLPTIRSGGFRVTGRVATRCSLTEPITGEVTVEASAVPICSIDVRLLRVESIALGERMATEITEIQTTQVAAGDICRGLSLPVYIILPRLLTCPTLSAGSFSLDFELSIIITFEAELSKLYAQSESSTSRQWVASETLPLRLVRL